MSDKQYPPVSFYFEVIFDGQKSFGDNSFQQVSGLEVEIEVEDVNEGGEMDVMHRLPKSIKYPSNLKLERGIAGVESNLVAWCREVFETDFSKPIYSKTIQVHLLNDHGEILHGWSMSNAIPVKWKIGAFHAMKNEIAIETIEIKYSNLKRIHV
uniref:phage tail protein n=1 Tax=Candidatus Electronema sp. TaxID=2698783 RepID=UPI00405698CC